MCILTLSKKFMLNDDFFSSNKKLQTERVKTRCVLSRRVRVSMYNGYKDVSKIMEYDRYSDDSLLDYFEKFGKSLMFNEELIQTTNFILTLSHQLFT
jgi:hypothetical protein